jgi:hypothetical protein
MWCHLSVSIGCRWEWFRQYCCWPFNIWLFKTTNISSVSLHCHSSWALLSTNLYKRLNFNPELPRPLHNALLALSSTRQPRGLTAENKRYTHPQQRSATSYNPSRLPVRSPTFAPSTLTHMKHPVSRAPLAAILAVIFFGHTLAMIHLLPPHQCTADKVISENIRMNPCAVKDCQGWYAHRTVRTQCKICNKKNEVSQRLPCPHHPDQDQTWSVPMATWNSSVAWIGLCYRPVMGPCKTATKMCKNCRVFCFIETVTTDSIEVKELKKWKYVKHNFNHIIRK